MDIPSEGLRISLGCGRHTPDDWFCVDVQQSPLASRAVDLISDVKEVPLPDACASEIMAIHVFEHLYRWECDGALDEWKRLLRIGGMLIMEMPDLFKFCRNILEAKAGHKHPDQLGMWGLYGDPRDKDPLMMHRWGWTFATIQPLLIEHGFTDCREERTQWHPVGRDVRDFRVTARKRA